MTRRGTLWLRRHPWTTGFVAFIALVLIFAHVVGFAIAEPLRRNAERRMNEALTGYSVRLGGLELNIFGLGLDLLDVTLIQTAHPKPPVAKLKRFAASIQWRALLGGHVVGDLILDSPQLLINLTQVKTEANDEKNITDHGWQEAVERIYPLKINELQIRHGEITYDDGGKLGPIHMENVAFLAQNVRNVSSTKDSYPSPVRLDGIVFESGKVHFDGAADFLARPHATLRGKLALATVPLEPLTPIVHHYGLQLRSGKLDADGDIEYATSRQTVDLERVTIDGIKAEFVQQGKSGEQGAQVAKKAVRDTTDPKNAPETTVRVDELRMTNGELAYVDGTADPAYRLFVSNLDVTVRDFSNRKEKGRSGTAQLEGAFMGSGSMNGRAKFQPTAARAEFETGIEIKDVDLVTMNDLLRARGGFDVKSGRFSLFSEIKVREGRVDGYVKPMFQDLDVYDLHQDSSKNIFRQAYEGIVGGIGTLLENRSRDEVATRTDLSGRIEDPKTSTLEIILGLIQNAFVQAILPGLDSHAERS